MNRYSDPSEDFVILDENETDEFSKEILQNLSAHETSDEPLSATKPLPEKISNIPTPDKAPESLDLTRIPKEVLQSSTVESLISQNDDLMARLKVSLRRHNQLEEEIIQSNQVAEELRKRIQVLGDQILIYRERDKVLRSRNVSTEKTHEKLEAALDLEKLRFNEYYQTTQNKITSLREENQRLGHALEKNVSAYNRYTSRIFRWVRPGIKQKAEEIKNLKESLKEVHQHIEKSGEYIRTQKEELENIKAKHHDQLEGVRLKNADLQVYYEKYLEMKEERTVHQNRVVAAERRREEIQKNYSQDIREVQEKLAEYRQQAKSFKAENQTIIDERNELQEELKHYAAENDRLQDQVESLQTIWNENRRKSEESLEKQRGINELNKELSLKVSNLTKEIESERKRFENEKENLEKKIGTLTTQIETMELSPQQDSNTESNPISADNNATSPSALEKIEFLLSELKNSISEKKKEGLTDKRLQEPVIENELSSHKFVEEDLVENDLLDTKIDENWAADIVPSEIAAEHSEKKSMKSDQNDSSDLNQSPTDFEENKRTRLEILLGGAPNESSEDSKN